MIVRSRWVIATAAFVVSSAAAQGVVTQRILSLAAARTIAETALDACASRGFRTSVVVVDRSGDPLVVLRHELAHPVTVEMARSKAYTAVVFRGSTMDFQRDTANDPARLPQRDVPGILALGGGVPIYSAGEIIGARCELGLEPADRRRVRQGGRDEGESLLE